MDIQLYKTKEGIITCHPQASGVRRSKLALQSFWNYREAARVIVDHLNLDTRIGVPLKNRMLSSAQKCSLNDVMITYENLDESEIEATDAFEIPVANVQFVEALPQKVNEIESVGTDGMPNEFIEEVRTKLVATLAENAACPNHVLLVVDTYENSTSVENSIIALNVLGITDITVFAIECIATPVEECELLLKLVLPDKPTELNPYVGRITQWNPTRAGIATHLRTCTICNLSDENLKTINDMILSDNYTEKKIQIFSLESWGIHLSNDNVNNHRRFMPYVLSEDEIQRIKIKAEDYVLGIRAIAVTAMEEKILSIKQDSECAQEKIKAAIWNDTVPALVKRIHQEAIDGHVPVRDLAYALDLIMKNGLLLNKAMIDPMSVLNGDSKSIKSKTVVEDSAKNTITTLVDIMMLDNGGNNGNK